MFYCLNHRTAGVMQAGGLCMSHPLFSRFFWRQPVSLQSEQRSVNPRQPTAQRQQQVHDPLQITCKQQTGQRHYSYLLERTYFLVCSSYYLRCSTRLDFRSYYIFFIFVYLFSKVIKPLSTKDRNTYVWNLGSLKAYLLWMCNENDIFLLFVTLMSYRWIRCTCPSRWFWGGPAPLCRCYPPAPCDASAPHTAPLSPASEPPRCS